MQVVRQQPVPRSDFVQQLDLEDEEEEVSGEHASRHQSSIAVTFRLTAETASDTEPLQPSKQRLSLFGADEDAPAEKVPNGNPEPASEASQETALQEAARFCPCVPLRLPHRPKLLEAQALLTQL